MKIDQKICKTMKKNTRNTYARLRRKTRLYISSEKDGWIEIQQHQQQLQATNLAVRMHMLLSVWSIPLDWLMEIASDTHGKWNTTEPHRQPTVLVFFFVSHASNVFGNVCDLLPRRRSLLSVAVRLWTNEQRTATSTTNNNDDQAVEFYSFCLTICVWWSLLVCVLRLRMRLPDDPIPKINSTETENFCFSFSVIYVVFAHTRNSTNTWKPLFSFQILFFGGSHARGKTAAIVVVCLHVWVCMPHVMRTRLPNTFILFPPTCSGSMWVISCVLVALIRWALVSLLWLGARHAPRQRYRSTATRIYMFTIDDLRTSAFWACVGCVCCLMRLVRMHFPVRISSRRLTVSLILHTHSHIFIFPKCVPNRFFNPFTYPKNSRSHKDKKKCQCQYDQSIFIYEIISGFLINLHL